MHDAINGSRSSGSSSDGRAIAVEPAHGPAADIAAGGRRLPDRIRHLLAWQFGVDVATIESQTELVDQLYADSLDLMEMTHILNREFDIALEPEHLAEMHTVGGVERVVGAMLDKRVFSAP